jgi:sugar phosphate isomerase/epimerase
VNAIGFSTLGCPDWSLNDTLARGRAWGYDAIEVGIVDGELVGPGMPADERARVAAQLRASGLAVTAVASSVRLVRGNVAAAELHALLEIAAQWRAPWVRVLSGALDPAAPRSTQLEAMAEVVRGVLPLVERLGVGVALATDHDLSAAGAAAELLALVEDPGFGVIWDVLHTWRAGDTPSDAWHALADRLVEIQVKDARAGPDGPIVATLLGDGDVPWRECLSLADGGDFLGPLVVEWEKRWHPEIAEPDVAMPQHLAVIRGAMTTA